MADDPNAINVGSILRVQLWMLHRDPDIEPGKVKYDTPRGGGDTPEISPEEKKLLAAKNWNDFVTDPKDTESQVDDETWAGRNKKRRTHSWGIVHPNLDTQFTLL